VSDFDAIELLRELGFTQLEAQIYTFLLRESPATGYRIAKAIGKPAANTYKALESLEKKGAVMFNHDEKRVFRAVPHREVLSHMERRFKDRKESLENALSTLSEPPADERIYQIRSVDEVFERCRSMLDRVQEIAFIDISPFPLKTLLQDIEKCASRGVDITLKVYEPIEIPGIKIVEDTQSDQVEHWVGHCVNMVIDVAEYLIGEISADGTEVQQAFWSCSPFLTLYYQGGLKREIVLDEINHILAKNGPIEEVKKLSTNIWDKKLQEAPRFKAVKKKFKK